METNEIYKVLLEQREELPHIVEDDFIDRLETGLISFNNKMTQVAYDISNPKTLSRELSALAEASEKTGCRRLTLIACTDTRTVNLNGTDINIISSLDWLLPPDAPTHFDTPTL